MFRGGHLVAAQAVARWLDLAEKHVRHALQSPCRPVVRS